MRENRISRVSSVSESPSKYFMLICGNLSNPKAVSTDYARATIQIVTGDSMAGRLARSGHSKFISNHAPQLTTHATNRLRLMDGIAHR